MTENKFKAGAMSKEQYAYNKKLMTRYAGMKARQNGELPPKEEVITDILDAIIAITAAVASGNLLGALIAGKQLVHLASKYGPIVWDMYKNYRKRQQKLEKTDEKTVVPPTAHALQEFLSEHADKNEAALVNADLRKFFTATQKRVSRRPDATRKEA